MGMLCGQRSARSQRKLKGSWRRSRNSSGPFFLGSIYSRCTRAPTLEARTCSKLGGWYDPNANWLFRSKKKNVKLDKTVTLCQQEIIWGYFNRGIKLASTTPRTCAGPRFCCFCAWHQGMHSMHSAAWAFDPFGSVLRLVHTKNLQEMQLAAHAVGKSDCCCISGKHTSSKQDPCCNAKQSIGAKVMQSSGISMTGFQGICTHPVAHQTVLDVASDSAMFSFDYIFWEFSGQRGFADLTLYEIEFVLHCWPEREYHW